MNYKRDHGAVLGLIVVLTWSTCFVVIKAGHGQAPPLLFGGLRAMVAAAGLLTIAAVTKSLMPPRETWPWLILLGILNTTLGLAGMFLSVKAVGATIPAVIANSQVLIVAPFAALLFNERLPVLRIVGLILGVIGVALALFGNTDEHWSVAGAALGLIAAVGIAGGSLVIKHIGSRVNPLTATAWQFLIGAIPLLTFSLFLESESTFRWTPGFVAALLFLGLGLSASASWLWFRIIKTGDLIQLNGLTMLGPAFAAALAFVIYREPLDGRQFLGIFVTLVGVVIVGRGRRVPVGDRATGLLCRLDQIGKARKYRQDPHPPLQQSTHRDHG